MHKCEESVKSWEDARNSTCRAHRPKVLYPPHCDCQPSPGNFYGKKENFDPSRFHNLEASCKPYSTIHMKKSRPMDGAWKFEDANT